MRHGAAPGQGGEDFAGHGTFERPLHGLLGSTLDQVGVAVGAGALVAGIRFFTTWCRAALACRSPPRESRCRSVRPELAGIDAVPHSAAKEAEERSRSGLSPAVISSWEPTTAPTPLIASRAGLAVWPGSASAARGRRAPRRGDGCLRASERSACTVSA